jgi:hypothetical protein
VLCCGTLLSCVGIAPPCVDCITAEAVVEQTTHTTCSINSGGGDAPDTPSSPPPPTNDISSQVLVASAATPRASGRYNLRSRTGAAGASLTPSTEGGLTKPLLADTTATLLAAADAFDVHEHGSGGHHHHHHGGHVSHVPHHHHAVPSGDLKQGVVLLVAMSVHTFLECMALGLMVRNCVCVCVCVGGGAGVQWFRT